MPISQGQVGEDLTSRSSSSFKSSPSMDGTSIEACPPPPQDVKETGTPTYTWRSPSITQNSSQLFHFPERLKVFRQEALWRDHLVECAEGLDRKVSEFSLSPPPSPSAHHADINIEYICSKLESYQQILDRRYEDYGEEAHDSRRGFTPELVRERYSQRMEEWNRAMAEPSEEDEEPGYKPILCKKRRASWDSTASQGKAATKRKSIEQGTTSDNERSRKKPREDNNQYPLLSSEKENRGKNISVHPAGGLGRTMPWEPRPWNHTTPKPNRDSSKRAKAGLTDGVVSRNFRAKGVGPGSLARTSQSFRQSLGKLHRIVKRAGRKEPKASTETLENSSLQHSNHDRTVTSAQA